MHTLKLISWLGLLGACVAGAQQGVPADPIEARFRAGVANARDRFTAVVAEVRIVGGSISQSASKSASAQRPISDFDEPGVTVSDFQNVIAVANRELEQAMSDPALAGMRAYAQMSLSRLEVKTVQSARWGPCVRMDDAKRVFATVLSLLERMRSVDTLKLDLRVATEPTGASVRLAPVGGGFATQISSDGTITNFYRGYYSYRVQKAKCKIAEGNINLVDQRGTRLFCRLPLAAAGGDEKVLCDLQEP